MCENATLHTRYSASSGHLTHGSSHLHWTQHNQASALLAATGAFRGRLLVQTPRPRPPAPSPSPLPPLDGASVRMLAKAAAAATGSQTGVCMFLARSTITIAILAQGTPSSDAAWQVFCFLAGVRNPAGAKSFFEATGPHQEEPNGIIYDISRGRKGALIFLVFVGRGGAESS